MNILVSVYVYWMYVCMYLDTCALGWFTRRFANNAQSNGRCETFTSENWIWTPVFTRLFQNASKIDSKSHELVPHLQYKARALRPNAHYIRRGSHRTYIFLNITNVSSSNWSTPLHCRNVSDKYLPSAEVYCGCLECRICRLGPFVYVALTTRGAIYYGR